MTVTPAAIMDLAGRIAAGKEPAPEELGRLAAAPEEAVPALLAGADLIRARFFGRGVHLCTIINGKSGRCSEDCGFCSQSAHARTGVEVYPLMEPENLARGAGFARQAGAHRYSVVTSGRRLSRAEVKQAADGFSRMDGRGLHFCASLGILDDADMEVLRSAGVTRYHHNLESARSFFPNVCTTHTYDERVETIRAARRAGLSLCVGGLFGMGETDEQVLELALALKELDVDAVPVNFLVAIPGTRMEGRPAIRPLRGLKIIALLRFVLPQKEIIICGGRVTGLGSLHPLVFWAGASGIMTGNYLTTQGRGPEEDLAMIEELGFSRRA
ncbi:MAG: biotin synthase BioB [Thermodesulfobacteriota bacterium]